jgi:hypothetical protein
MYWQLCSERLTELAFKFYLGQRSLTSQRNIFTRFLQTTESRPSSSRNTPPHVQTVEGNRFFFILIPVIDSSFHFTFTPYCSLFSYISSYLVYVIIVDSSFPLLSSLFITLARISQRLQRLRNYYGKSEVRIYVCNRQQPPCHLNVQAIRQTQTYYVVSVTAVFPPRSLPTVRAKKYCEQHKSLGFHAQGSTGFNQLPK